MERTVREIRPLKISENVYWISAAAAARYPRGGGKGIKAWCRLGRRQRYRATHYAAFFTQAKADALDAAAELQAFVQARFLQAVGLAFAGGILSASMLSLLSLA
jgi:hypothetical protein